MNGAQAAPATAAASDPHPQSKTYQEPQQQSPKYPPVLPLLSTQHAKIHLMQATLPSPGAESFASTAESTLSPARHVNLTDNHSKAAQDNNHLQGHPIAPSQSNPQNANSHSHSHCHTNHNNISQGTVLSRLSALFHHEPGPTSALSPAANPPVAFPGADTDDDLFLDLNDTHSPRASTPPPRPDERPAPPDRNAIKVLVVTWNMGDALPKGDLSVLLGDVPAYEPNVARDCVEGLPRLPAENLHPYHVVVFAAQECPTPSGVPRGLGGGLMKGVGLQKPETLFRREKEGDGKEGTATPIAKEPNGKKKDKDKDGKELREGSKEDKPLGEDKDKPLGHTNKDKQPSVHASKDKSASKDKHLPMPSIDTGANGPSGTSTPRKVGSLGLDKLGLEGLVSPTRHLPLQSPTEEKMFPFDDERHHHLLHHHLLSDHRPALRPPAGMAPGPKGWSAMLEEWLCAGPRTNMTQTSTPLGPSMNATPNNTLDLTTGPANTAYVLSTPPVLSTSLLPDTPPVITMSPVDMVSEPPWSNGSPFSAPPPTPPKPISSPPLTPSKPRSTAPATPAKPIGIPGSLSVPPSSYYGRSPLSASTEPANSHVHASGSSIATTNYGSTTSGSSVFDSSYLAPPPFPVDRPDREMNRSPSQRSDRSQRLDLLIPDRPRRAPGEGPYVNVAKERLMGLYLSVFVYRGCEHLVRGVDKDYVTAGLAGGRFGNKGGIGISLNLNGHRLLFINAHLAAHAERNDARIANISKIKSELNLNCFLPTDDPRSTLEDITDRFDTTFWCGDLNFRVDISLLHARWLLEQKKYQDALMFDQLKTAMENPTTNPFRGFEEAPITFMPTFKYDVWKSVRATNREIRRSLRRRRNTLERPLGEAAAANNLAALEFVPEGDGPEESGSDTRDDKGKSSGWSGGEDEGKESKRSRSVEDDEQNCISDSDLPPPPPICEDGNRLSIQSTPDGYSIPDGASGRSSLYVGDMTQSFAHSFTTTDTTPRMSGDFSVRRASLLAHSPLTTTSFSFNSDSIPRSPVPKPKGFKERTKKLLGILSLARRPSQPRPPPLPRSNLMTPADDASSRRLSISSFRSGKSGRSGGISDDARSHISVISSEGPVSPCLEDIPDKDKERTSSAERSERNGERNGHAAGGDGPGHSHSQSNGHARRSSNASQNILTSPPRRHLSIIRRTGSGRSGAPPVEEEYSFDLDDFDETKDHRVGRYDTSKKQRIPSWCDRVLYKTHIIPDDDEVIEEDDESSRFEITGRFHRISHALSNLGDHFRRRSMAFEPASLEKDRDELSAPATPPARLETTGDSVAQSIMRDTDKSSELLRDSPENMSKDLNANGDDSGPGSGLRSLGGRSITFDGLPATPRTGRYPDFMSAGTSPEKDARISPLAKPRRTSSATESTPARRTSQPRQGSVSSRRGSVSGGSLSLPRRRQTEGNVGALDKLTPVKSTGHSSSLSDNSRRRLSGDLKSEDAPASASASGTRSRRQSTETGPPPSMNVIARFLRDLPGRFHSRVSLFHGSDVDPELKEDRRHLAGEVEVLHYGTIDDAGMRQLEGRSDHRPAIFAANVYV